MIASTTATKAELHDEWRWKRQGAGGEDHTAEESYKLLKKELAEIKQKPDRKQGCLIITWIRNVYYNVTLSWFMNIHI